MSSYEFSLRLNREVTDAEVEALCEAGCSDAAVETGQLGEMLRRYLACAPSAWRATARDSAGTYGRPCTGSTQCSHVRA
jgi:hypothetical protein